jgi:hypothetical protein
MVGVASNMVAEIAQSRFEGECFFRNSNGRKFSEKFVCSVDAHQKQLVHDDELPKALHDMQEIPKELGRIANLLENFSRPDNK